ncbi:hypothetical protein GE061_018828 [Apolygus lucorum]|uniref:Uncharacterized protein n=1 Tax=Apolygus lucorum TaxID=248454 RepID=A0A6A4J1L5_APOLU|nr:hypothetical protein GE061_018828 [Apolygus lucorum]
MSYPCGAKVKPSPRYNASSGACAEVKNKSCQNKLDIVIVDPSKRDKCLLAKGPALVERAWIMTRPPAELLIDHKLVTARKMQLVRDLINCWTGEYTRVVAPPPKPQVIKNCGNILKPQTCMMYSFNNCSRGEKASTCVYEP